MFKKIPQLWITTTDLDLNENHSLVSITKDGHETINDENIYLSDFENAVFSFFHKLSKSDDQ